MTTNEIATRILRVSMRNDCTNEAADELAEIVVDMLEAIDGKESDDQ